MRKFVKALASLAVLGLSAGSVAAADSETASARPSLAESQMKLSVRQAGYTIEAFKPAGVCYEVCGRDRHGRRAEVYYNPVDGSIASKG
jgi:hypothetical protein